MKTPAQLWEEKEREKDLESLAIMAEQERMLLEDRLNRLTPERRRAHDEFQHDPARCRCFAIEGIS